MTMWVWPPWGHTWWGSRRSAPPCGGCREAGAPIRTVGSAWTTHRRACRAVGPASPRIPEHGEEVFTSGAFGDDLKPVDLTLEHGGAKIGEVQPANSDRGLEVDGTYSGDLQGRDKFSIDFYVPGRIQDRKGSGSCILRSWSGSHPSGDPIYRGCRDRAQTTGCSSFS